MNPHLLEIAKDKSFNAYFHWFFQAALDAIGFRLGQMMAHRFTATSPPLVQPLEAIKWVCKDLWVEVFRKGIDNLRTNHRGTFVLRDTQFPWTMRLSQNFVALPERIASNDLAADFLVLPCGIIRGALHALGLETTVAADSTALPQCDFTVVIVPSPAAAVQ